MKSYRVPLRVNSRLFKLYRFLFINYSNKISFYRKKIETSEEKKKTLKYCIYTFLLYHHSHYKVLGLHK